MRPQPPEHPTTHASALNTRDDLRELADLYETVAALDLAPDPGMVGHTTPGSRLPPGLQEILDAEEIAAALRAVADWAESVARVVAEECDVTLPDLTPARLRTVAAHAGHMVDHADEMLALTFCDDLATHLRVMRRLFRRAVRRVRTGVRCQDPTCKGHLVSPLGVGDRSDDALECDRCHARTPYLVWSAWPRARIQYVTVEHAAHMAGTTVDVIRHRAARGKWRRVGTGRQVRYHVDDVRAWERGDASA